METVTSAPSAKSSPVMTWMPLLVSLGCLFSALLITVQASDADPLQDFCVADLSSDAPRVNGYPCKLRSNVTAADFTTSILRKAMLDPATLATGAVPTFTTVNEFPALNTQGLAHARLDFAVGGVIAPHTHPLATETLFVVKGTIYTGFISSDNVLFASTLHPGDLTVFPRASQHFQINVGKGTATTFNTLNSQNPGFYITSTQLFKSGIPSNVLEKTLGISAKAVKNIQDSIPRGFQG